MLHIESEGHAVLRVRGRHPAGQQRESSRSTLPKYMNATVGKGAHASTRVDELAKGDSWVESSTRSPRPCERGAGMPWRSALVTS